MTVLPFSTIRNGISGGSSGEISMPILLDFVDSVQALSSGGTSYSAVSATATGSDQSTASPLTGLLSIISSGATGTGVLLAAATGQIQIVCNATATTKVVYPTVGMVIGSMSAGAGVSLGPGLSIGVVVSSSSQAYIVFSSSAFG